MTSKMRSIIQEAGYSICQSCFGDGTNIAPCSRDAQDASDGITGGNIIALCPACHGDGVIISPLVTYTFNTPVELDPRFTGSCKTVKQ